MTIKTECQKPTSYFVMINGKVRLVSINTLVNLLGNIPINLVNWN